MRSWHMCKSPMLTVEIEVLDASIFIIGTVASLRCKYGMIELRLYLTQLVPNKTILPFVMIQIQDKT